MGVLPTNMTNDLRSWFRGNAGTAYATAPTTLYLALFTGVPTGDATGAEVSTSGTAYARQAITCATGFADNGAGAFTNVNDIVFPTATASFGTVVGWALMSASTAGTRRLQGLLGAPQAVDTGKIFKVRAGELDCSFAAV